MKLAAIDNDFLSHLAQTNGMPDDVCTLIRGFFQDLDLSPRLHELIWQNETRQNDPVIQQLLSNQIVLVCMLDQMFENDLEKKRYYELLIQEIYQQLHGENYPCQVFTEWIAQRSLGEVHCIVMCMFIDCVCLLSDDKDAKALREVMRAKAGCDIPILSRTDCQNYIKEHLDSENRSLRSRDLRRLCHTNV